MNIKKEINVTIAERISADFYSTVSGMVYCDVFIDGMCVGNAFGVSKNQAFKEAICKAMGYLEETAIALYSDEPTVPTLPPPPPDTEE